MTDEAGWGKLFPYEAMRAYLDEGNALLKADRNDLYKADGDLAFKTVEGCCRFVIINEFASEWAF